MNVWSVFASRVTVGLDTEGYVELATLFGQVEQEKIDG